MNESKEDSNQLTISAQDAENINRLVEHFNFPRSKEYEDAYSNFKNNLNDPAAAKAMIHEIAKIMHANKDKSELLTNIFPDIFSSCEKITYDMQFDMDLEDIVGVDATPDQASDS